MTSLSEAPLWLLALVVDAEPATSRTGRPASDATGAIETGRRNSTLTSLAGTMRQRGFSESAIEAALLAENHGRCLPPLDDEEVSRIARSVARYPPGRLAIPDRQAGRRFQILHVGGIELTVKQRGSGIG
jgi:putative DNA primase/helicase